MQFSIKKFAIDAMIFLSFTRKSTVEICIYVVNVRMLR